jgi:hypothetical protein
VNFSKSPLLLANVDVSSGLSATPSVGAVRLMMSAMPSDGDGFAGPPQSAALGQEPISRLSLTRWMLSIGSREPPPVSSEPACLIHVVINSK